MDTIQRYQDYISRMRGLEAKRLGYPVVGATGSDEALGIIPGSIADTYLNNVGNPYSIPTSFHHHTKIFEQEVIALCARYLGMAEDTRGYITTGGTEGNFAGLWWAREYCGATPRLFVSDQAHYSIPKAAAQLQLKIETIPSTERGSIDLQSLKERLMVQRTKRPQEAIIVVATAGTTEKGGIDDVLEIRALLDEIIIQPGGIARLHLDAALLGFAMPVLFPDNYHEIFRAVDTVAISAHKLLASRTIISGLILTSESFLDAVFPQTCTKIGCIGNVIDITVSGSRSGFQAIALHHRLLSLGFDKNGDDLKNQIIENIKLAEYLHTKLIEIIDPSQVLWGDNKFTVSFPKPTGSEKLTLKYSLMPVNNNRLGICVLSHVTRAHIEEFIHDYRELVQGSHDE